MSILKVGILMVLMTALLTWIGHALGGPIYSVGALILAVCLNFSAYWWSDKLVLSMTRAQPVSPAAAPELYEIVNRLSQRAQIPNPTLYVVDDPSPNAFATGRDPSRGVVCVNRGLLDRLDRGEIEGVIAHEISHIAHRDTLTMAMVAAMAGAIMTLASIARFMGFFAFGGRDRDSNPLVLLVIAIFAPLAAIMVQATISRSREFEADRYGAELAGTPIGLAHALEKIEEGAERIQTRTFNESTAHLAIINPFAGMGGLAGLFSSHPPTKERIARLMAMRDQPGTFRQTARV